MIEIDFFTSRKIDGNPVESIDQYIEREQETLNCLICNQMFSTSHNKKEHLLGRGHLLKLMNGFDLFKSDRSENEEMPAKNATNSTATNLNFNDNPSTSLILANPNSPSFRDNLHTDSSNATTEDYWNSPSRATLTPETSNNTHNATSTVDDSVKARTLSSSSQPSEPSPVINHSKDALLSAIEQPMETTNLTNTGLIFDMDSEADKTDFDMTNLDLPDDFNITHDYLNDLQSSKLEHISPSFDYQPARMEQGNLPTTPKQEVLDPDLVSYGRQGEFNVLELCPF